MADHFMPLESMSSLFQWQLAWIVDKKGATG
jgi:hypothetical protein